MSLTIDYDCTHCSENLTKFLTFSFTDTMFGFFNEIKLLHQLKIC